MRAPDDDRELMLRYARGETSAFTALYERHKGPLYRYLLRQCGHAANAEEIFQDTWMKVVRARARYRPEAKFTTWLYRIAHNASVDRARKHGRTTAHDAPDLEPDELGTSREAPETQAAHSQVLQRLGAALAALPPEQREAFLLREEGGLSLAEIGEVTGVGRETVKSRLRYALAKLRGALGDDDD